MAEVVQQLRVQVIITGRVIGDNGALMDVNETYDQTFTDGSGAAQVAKVVRRDATTSSTATDYDLGTVTDFQGAAAAITKAKVFYVRNFSDTAFANLQPGSTNAATTPILGTNPKVSVGKDGLLLMVDTSAAGWAMAASTDTMAVETSESSQSYRFLVAGGIG